MSSALGFRLIFFVLILLAIATCTFVSEASVLHRANKHSNANDNNLNTQIKSKSEVAYGVNILAPVAVDCPIKTFAAQFASYLQPSTWPHESNWTRDVVDAFQLPTKCNITADDIPQPPFIRPTSVDLGLVGMERVKASCTWNRYVDGTNGNNKNSGDQSSPWKTVTYAVVQSRTRDLVSDYYGCIIIRGGTYYLASELEVLPRGRYASQTGVIRLTSADSGLSIQGASGERVIFSGGIPLNLTWSKYAGNIMMAKLTGSSALAMDDWQHFNELYYEGWRGIRAKYPNGKNISHYSACDPFLTGRHTSPSGYFQGASSWVRPAHPLPAATEIHVSEPAPAYTRHFPQFQIGIEGTAHVFEPPHSYWALANPPGGGGSTYRQPLGFVATSDFGARLKNYSNPTTGFLFNYHCDSWGSNQYSIGSVNLNNLTIMFGRGGFQEVTILNSPARGCDTGNQDMYIHNIMEELDSDNEWFYDRPSSTLYYQPNQTTGMPATVIASQLSGLISIHGTQEDPVSEVQISGIIFTQTANHFMENYEVPSGGDYSIHRGGAIFATGTRNLSITSNSFYQLGGNAIVIADYNRDAFIYQNQFRWLGESCVILAGVADGIDGVSNLNQPNSTLIESNLFREFSNYVKQGDAVFESVVRNSIWAGNAAFNAPRSEFNKNDGFAGGLNAYQNLMFNANREVTIIKTQLWHLPLCYREH